MPTYQYACKECDHQFEVVQSFSDASLTDCPQCQGPLRKLFGAVGVIFKGSGFYRNDARSESKSSSTSGSSGTSNGSGKGNETSSKSDSGTGKGSAGSSGSGNSAGSSGSAGSSSSATTKAAS